MALNDFYRPAALLLVLLPVMGACTKDPGQDAIRAAQATRQAIEKMPPECALGAPAGPQGTWLTTTKAVPGTGPGIVNVFSFDKAVTTHALRVALDLQALRDIEKVETRDAQGNWSDAGPVVRREAPSACEYVWMVQELPDARQVDALRFTFRQAPGRITVSNPGVLQEVTR